MSHESPILPEDLFREGFHDFEAPENPQAWEHMRALLDKEQDVKPVAIIPDTNKKNNKKYNLKFFIIMTTVTLFSLATWLTVGISNHTNTAGSAEKNTATQHNSNTAASKSKHNTDAEATGRNSTGTADYNNKKYAAGATTTERSSIIQNDQIKTVQQVIEGNIHKAGSTVMPGDTSKKTSTVKSIQTAATEGKVLQNTVNNVIENSKGSAAVKPLVSLLDSPKINNGKYKNVVVRKEWVPDEYEYVSLPKKGAIDDFWIGMHFTEQNLLSDTINAPRKPAGFNLQFMSGNLLKQTDVVGAYLGFDWGMQFYGRSKNSNVVINTVKQDSGYTRLNTVSTDFLLRGHLEYARFPLIPYVNAFAGPRLYFTDQKVASYLKLSDNASSSRTNAHTSASMIAGIGVGARLRLTPSVSIDARYEMMWGTNVKVVDLDASKFNGLNYDLKLKQISPNYEQIKFGVIFDLSAAKEEKKLVTPGHYEERVYDSVYVDPKDSNVRYLPCPCNPCDKKQIQENEMEQQNNNNNNNNNSIPGSTTPRRRNSNTIYTPGSSGGSSRGSFPGIKPPPVINK